MISFFIAAFVTSIIAVFVVHRLFHARYDWLELVLQGIIPIVVSIGVFSLLENARYYDTEYWGEVARKVVHEEDYEYWTTCTETYPCGTDANGNTEYCTRTYPCCDWVPDRYFVLTTNNRRYIGRDDYRHISSKFGNEKVVGRQGDCRSGDILEATWNGTEEKFHPVTIKTKYKNKVRFSNVYKTRELTKKEKIGMFGYPAIKEGLLQDAIYGKSKGFTDQDLKLANKKLMKFNATQGELPREKHGQVRCFIFLYDDDVKARNHIHFIGGVNKNELLVVIGPNFYDVYAFGNEGIVNDLKIILFNRKYTLNSLVDSMSEYVKDKWLRKKFTDLNRVISVQPSPTNYIVGMILNLLLNVGLVFLFYHHKLID